MFLMAALKVNPSDAKQERLFIEGWPFILSKQIKVIIFVQKKQNYWVKACIERTSKNTFG